MHHRFLTLFVVLPFVSTVSGFKSILPFVRGTGVTNNVPFELLAQKQAAVEQDCGCAPSTSFSGEPSNIAMALNARKALQGTTVFNAAGQSVSMDTLLPPSGSTQPVITVFLRSLG